MGVWVGRDGHALTDLERRIYERAGLSGVGALEWYDAGIYPYAAETFRGGAFTLDDASTWKEAGVPAGEAVEARRLGLSPQEGLERYQAKREHDTAMLEVERAQVEAERARAEAERLESSATAVAYGFVWQALPAPVLQGAAHLIRGGDEPVQNHPQAAAVLAEKFGTGPTADMVRMCGQVLVDHWLLHDTRAMSEVTDALEHPTDPAVNSIAFAQELTRSADACEAAAHWLFLRGLQPLGCPYDDLSRAWRPDEPLLIDYSPTAFQERLRSLLQVDDEWVVIEGDSWTWWPTATPISVTVGPARVVYGDVSYRVRARCELLNDVVLEEAELLDRLSIVNEGATLFAVVHNEEHGSIEATCAFTLHAGNESLGQLFSAALVLLAGLTREVEAIAEYFGGNPVRVPHPLSGLREDADEMADYVDLVVIPSGADPSLFAADASKVDFTALHGCVYQGPNDKEGSAQAEFTFYHNLPACLVGELEWTLGTSLVKVDGAGTHPELGNGLEVRLSVPDLEPFPPHFAAVAAQLLNRLEADEETGVTFLGAWWARRREDDARRYDLQFSQFLPSAFYQPGLTGTVAWTMAERNRWLHDWREEVVRSMARDLRP